MSSPVRPMLCSLCALCMWFCVSSLVMGAGSEAAWLKRIPVSQAIRIGSGRKIVIEVSDPDCPFSRKMVGYWDKRHDVSRYIFLIDLKTHPEAAEKVRYILCAADRVAAYREVYGGKLDFDEKPFYPHCDDQGLQEKYRKVGARLRITGTPTYFINGVKVNGAKVKEIEKLLGGKKVPFDSEDLE